MILKNSKIIKKLFKIFIYILTITIILIILSYLVFRNSKVQTFVAQKAATYLSKQLNTEISVGGVDITYYLNITLEDITIKDRQNKIILFSKEIKIKISDLKYKSKILKINNLSFKNAHFFFRKYKDTKENNIKFILDYFINDSIKNTDEKNNKWLVKCSNLKIINSFFIFQDQIPHEEHKGIDFKNIKISNLNLYVNDIYYNKDTISAKINLLTLDENKGLSLNNMSADVFFCSKTFNIKKFKLKTSETDISADYNFNYSDIDAFKDIFNKVEIKCKISPSKINFKDVSYFFPNIYGMSDNINISGEFSGKLSDIKIKKLICLYSDSTRFWGDISLKGLPDIENTFINSNIKEFSLNIEDLKSIKLPEIFNKKIKIPDNMKGLKDIKINGSFKGYYYDFVSTSSLKTNLGNINSDISFKKNPKINKYEYNGKIDIRNFDFNKILFENKKNIGKINLNANISGSGLTKDDVKLNFKGDIDSLLLYDNVYNKINVVGDLSDNKFNGLLSVNDENVFFDFKGLVDFNSKVPVLHFTSNIKNANLFNLNILKRDSVSILNTKLKINLTGDNIDNLKGNVKFLNTSFQEAETIYKLNNLELTQNIDSLKNKTLTLNSELVDINVNGNFSFKGISKSFKYFLSKYLPSFYNIDTTFQFKNQDFNFNVNLKNTKALSKLIYPSINISNNSFIKGGFNSLNNKYYFNANSDLIEYKGIKINNLYLSQNSDNDKTTFKTHIKKIIFKESNLRDTLELGIDSLVLNTEIFSDTINYSLVWDDVEKTDKNKGIVKGFVSFKNSPEIKIKFTDADIRINDSLWTISENNLITIDTSSVNISNFAFIGDNQQLLMNGVISENPIDNFNLKFNDFDISYFDIILNNRNVDIDGIIKGDLKIIDVYNSPNYISDFKIKDFYLNHQKLGDLFIKTNWDDEKNHLIVNSDIIYQGNFAKTKPLSIKGYYAPDNIKNSFNFDMILKNFKIKTLSPFLKKFSSKIEGLATGNLRLYNDRKNSYLVGKVKLKRSEMKIDYLNVTYSFADYINLKKYSIDFDNITLHDTLGNTALLNGKYYHNFFMNSVVDINIKPKKISCLDLEPYQNNMFFGKGVASGDVSIKGPIGNIIIDVKAKTERGTDITIPINLDESITDNKFIKFTSKDDTIADIENIYVVNLKGYRLLFDFDISDEAQIKIFLPNQMGNIQVNGYGNLKMNYNSENDFNIFGDYYMNKGSFAFSLQNMINRHFTIRKGGYIKWNGDPYDADINLKAVYKVRATLNGLENLTQLDESYYNKKINVECVLGLTGKISNPEINFSIDLPNVDDETKQLIYSAIDTSNTVVMNEQMISLLVLNSFSFKNENTSIANTLGLSSFELLSNQLSNLLSKLSDDFDIGVNYAPGDEITNEELEVALSTQLFNDRVLIDGNVGVRGDKHTQRTSNIVGDVNVEVKITKDGRLRVKAFNISNNIDLLSEYAPYTQGVGIFYRKEFDNLKEFFRNKNRKAKRKEKKK